jgi:tRNA synthetases class I (M)
MASESCVVDAVNKASPNPSSYDRISGPTCRGKPTTLLCLVSRTVSRMVLRPCVRCAGNRLLSSPSKRHARLYSSSPNGHNKPYYLTTPIFYPNSGMILLCLLVVSRPNLTSTSVPHIGHLYTLVTTDIFARYAKLARPDESVRFLTGTDEHGLKIQRAAETQNLEPLVFCDRISDRFRVCSLTHGWAFVC